MNPFGEPEKATFSLGSLPKIHGWASFFVKNVFAYIIDYQSIKLCMRIFFRKNAENALSIGEKFLFLHTFSEGKGRRKEADSSFTLCRYNSVGRVADL